MVQRILPEGIEGLRILNIILFVKMHLVCVNNKYTLLVTICNTEEDEEVRDLKDDEILSEIFFTFSLNLLRPCPSSACSNISG